MRRKYRYLQPVIMLLCLITWFSCSTSRPGPTTLYLVRHAEKEIDGTEDPGLTEAGRERAQKLAMMLKGDKVERLYSTNYKRTRQTLQPLAEQFDLDIRIYNHRDGLALDSMIADCMGKVAVIAGHSNSTPRLANRLIGKDVYPDFDESDYTRMLKLQLIKEKPVQHEVILY